MSHMSNIYIIRYESLALLICYMAYVSFMKFNAQAELWVKSKVGGGETAPSVKVNDVIIMGHNDVIRRFIRCRKDRL